MRTLVAMVAGLVACSKPSEEQCKQMEQNVRYLAGMYSADCPGDFTKDEVKCLTERGWLKITDCPGYEKLGIDKSRFSAVHCFSETDSNGVGRTDCSYPWVVCSDRRKDALSYGTGKTVSECETTPDPWAIDFACPDRGGQTCIEYFRTKADCEAGLPRVRASANNVRDCYAFGR
jgi:hypothetical protein